MGEVIDLENYRQKLKRKMARAQNTSPDREPQRAKRSNEKSRAQVPARRETPEKTQIDPSDSKSD